MAYFPLTKPARYRGDGVEGTPFAKGALQNADQLQKYGQPVTQQSLQNLFQLLQGQGRVDPRLLASAQAQNSASTQQQQDGARAQAARSGMGGGGLQAALQAAIGSAGATRSANLNYQDIADSYARNQANISQANESVTNPQLGYASLSADLFRSKSEADAQTKAARLGVIGSVFQGIGGMFGGCWVAEAIFGADAIETHLARFYVNVLASRRLHDAYMRDGQRLAAMVENDEALKTQLRPAFIEFGNRSRFALGV